jgi:hypothetical protein
MKDFIFVDLSLMGDAKKFDGMAAGKFTDMWGRETVFLPEELPAYVANTKLALASTADSLGHVVGFPIDSMGHYGEEAAGWITDVSMAEGRDIIEFTPRWNAIGMASIGSDTLRFFSPTIDIERRVIMGGSLTNWPATRTADHQILLRPVELSEQIHTYESMQNLPIVTLGEAIKHAFNDLKNFMSGLVQPTPRPEADPQGDLSMTMQPEPLPVEPIETPVALAGTPTPPAVVDLSSPDIVQMINAQAEARAAVILAEREHSAAVVQLADQLCGAGLPIDHDKALAFLQALPVELYPEAEAILTAAATRDPINFAEAGHARVVQGTQPLPDSIKPILTSWLEKGLSLESFFETNSVELGAMSDYNLTEFIKE